MITALTHGTLVVGAQGENFVVVGADSKGILGDLHGPIVVGTSRARKISLISENVVAAVYGVAEFGQHLAHQYVNTRDSDTDGVSQVLEEFRAFCRNKWNEWFANLDTDRQPPVGFVVVGLDKGEDETYCVPRIYSIDASLNFAPAFHSCGFACLGIPSLATFLMDENYQENMEVDDVIDLVGTTISRVAQTDPRVGLPVQIAVVDTTLGARMHTESYRR